MLGIWYTYFVMTSNFFIINECTNMFGSYKEGHDTVFSLCWKLLVKWLMSSSGNSRLPSESLRNGLINVEVNAICWNNLSCTNSFLIIPSSCENKICTGTVLLSCYSPSFFENCLFKNIYACSCSYLFLCGMKTARSVKWKIMYLLTRKKNLLFFPVKLFFFCTYQTSVTYSCVMVVNILLFLRLFLCKLIQGKLLQ